jgi:hypothetical protein
MQGEIIPMRNVGGVDFFVNFQKSAKLGTSELKIQNSKFRLWSTLHIGQENPDMQKEMILVGNVAKEDFLAMGPKTLCFGLYLGHW